VHRRRPGSTLFPYTTLFRSAGEERWSVDVDGYVPWLGAVDFVVADGGTAFPARGEDRPSVDPSRPLGVLERADGEPLAGSRNLPDRKSTRLNSSHVAISYAV